MAQSYFYHPESEVCGGKKLKMPLQFITNHWDKILWFLGMTGGVVYGAGRAIARHESVHRNEDVRFNGLKGNVDRLMDEHSERKHNCPMGFPGKLDHAIDELRAQMAQQNELLCSLKGRIEMLMNLLPELISSARKNHTRNSG